MHCKSSADRKIRPLDSLYGQTGVTILAPIDDFYVQLWSGLFYSWSDRTITQGSKRRNKLGFRRNVVCLGLYYYGLLQPCLWGNIIMLRFFLYVTSTRKMRRRMESPWSHWYFSTNSWIQSKAPLYYMGLLNRQLTPAFIVDTVCRRPSGVSPSYFHRRLPRPLPPTPPAPDTRTPVYGELNDIRWGFFLSICFPITRIQLYDNYDREIISCLPINSSSLTFVANRTVCIYLRVFFRLFLVHSTRPILMSPCEGITDCNWIEFI